MTSFYGLEQTSRAGFGVLRSWLDLSEMLVASSSVIHRRGRIIDKAFREPGSADHRELSTMVTEKQKAFASVAHVMIEESFAWQRFWTDEALSAGQSAPDHRACRRRMDACTRLIAAPAKALAPLHKAATANARRLR